MLNEFRLLRPPISPMYESLQLSQLMYVVHWTHHPLTLSFRCTNIYLNILVGLKYTFNPYPFISLKVHGVITYKMH